jgi:hypothetical protein
MVCLEQNRFFGSLHRERLGTRRMDAVETIRRKCGVDQPEHHTIGEMDDLQSRQAVNPANSLSIF